MILFIKLSRKAKREKEMLQKFKLTQENVCFGSVWILWMWWWTQNSSKLTYLLYLLTLLPDWLVKFSIKISSSLFLNDKFEHLYRRSGLVDQAWCNKPLCRKNIKCLKWEVWLWLGEEKDIFEFDDSSTCQNSEEGAVSTSVKYPHFF